MHVAEWMTRTLACAHADEELTTAADRMTAWRIRPLPVLRSDRLVGVVSERDIVAEGAQVNRRRVADVMHQAVITTEPRADLEAAAALMLRWRVGCLPVLDGEVLTGMLTRSDVLRARASLEPDDLEEPMTVAQAMRRHPARAVPDEPLMPALRRLESLALPALPVVDEDARPIGLLGEREVRAAVGNPLREAEPEDAATRLGQLRVAGIMGAPPPVVGPHEPLASAIALLLGGNHEALLVVDEHGRLAGILGYCDALRALRRPAPSPDLAEYWR